MSNERNGMPADTQILIGICCIYMSFCTLQHRAHSCQLMALLVV